MFAYYGQKLEMVGVNIIARHVQQQKQVDVVKTDIIKTDPALMLWLRWTFLNYTQRSVQRHLALERVFKLYLHHLTNLKILDKYYYSLSILLFHSFITCYTMLVCCAFSWRWVLNYCCAKLTNFFALVLLCQLAASIIFYLQEHSFSILKNLPPL